MIHSIKDYRAYFPFQKIRPQQEQALDFIINNMESKRFFIAELPPGVGKSGIAVALSGWITRNMPVSDQAGSYIVTTQKILQQQYINDFPNINNIWSKSNYTCKHRKGGISCEEGQFLAKTLDFGDHAAKECKENCIYTKAFDKFFNQSQCGVTNIAYMLNHIEYDPAGLIKDRQLLVVDECHNLEQSIVDFVAAKITKTYCKEVLGVPFPNISSIKDAFDWITHSYHPRLIKKLSEVDGKLADSKGLNATTNSLMRSRIEVDKRMCRTKRFIDRFDDKQWSSTFEEDFFEIKPIHASAFTDQQLFKIADKILLMSGTILDKDVYCKNTGINPEDACFLSLPSPFKKENRTVFILPSGSMSFKNIKNTLPSLNSTVQSIIKEHHPNEKGIIHAHTYTIAKYLKDNDKSGRMLLHTSANRMEVYEKHLQNKSNSILVSPSMTEGIDLINDHSRFQIICKIPFPYLKDNYIKSKMEKCHRWYEWMTIKTIVQALGRSVRSEQDHALSYVLDSDWAFFYNKNKDMFPNWFKESIINV